MKYVLDSNVALKGVLPEADSDRAIQLRDDFHSGTHELIAPDVFPVECLHALTKAERQSRITGGIYPLAIYHGGCPAVAFAHSVFASGLRNRHDHSKRDL